jgi:hypothetical protein
VQSISKTIIYSLHKQTRRFKLAAPKPKIIILFTFVTFQNTLQLKNKTTTFILSKLEVEAGLVLVKASSHDKLRICYKLYSKKYNLIVDCNQQIFRSTQDNLVKLLLTSQEL